MRTGTRLILAAVVLALLLIAGKLFLSASDFSPANTGWNGISSIMTDRARPLYSFDQLSYDVANSTLLIVGPTRDYSPYDSGAVSSFLQRGGRVVILDDFGTANALLRDIGSPIAIDPRPVCQDDAFYGRYNFSVVSPVRTSALTANVSRLVFNHPAMLQASGDAVVLAQTTAQGWIDDNSNGMLDLNDGEKYGCYPLVAMAPYGAGELFVAADPDLVINSMTSLKDSSGKKYDDDIFTGNILRTGTVYLDLAHGQAVPPLARLYYAIKYNVVAQILFALLTFMLGYAYLVLNRIFRRREPEKSRPDTRETLIASMKARLPLSNREIEEIKKKL